MAYAQNKIIRAPESTLDGQAHEEEQGGIKKGENGHYP